MFLVIVASHIRPRAMIIASFTSMLRISVKVCDHRSQPDVWGNNDRKHRIKPLNNIHSVYFYSPFACCPGTVECFVEFGHEISLISSICRFGNILHVLSQLVFYDLTTSYTYWVNSSSMIWQHPTRIESTRLLLFDNTLHVLSQLVFYYFVSWTLTKVWEIVNSQYVQEQNERSISVWVVSTY